MKVLSLFDGMSCGQLALNRLNIKVDTYYASEIDKYAMQVTQANFPETIQVGDVCNLDPNDFKDVDLMLAGSPCQGFSFAGKQLAFDDPRSALFFEFIRLLKEIKPKYFLLENVKMKKEYLQVISEQVSACYPEIPFGIEPIFINSSLVSAQNRQRYYWTNIPNITQPEERGIVLRDILEENPAENPVKDTKRNRRHHKNPDQKSLCMTASMYKGAGNNGMTLVPQKIHDIPRDLLKDNERQRRVYSKDGKSPTLLARPDSPKVMKSDKPIRVGMNVEQVKVRKHEVDIKALQNLLRQSKADAKKTNKLIAEEINLPITKVEHWFRTDKSFAIPSDDIWFKLKEVLSISDDTFDKQIMEFEYRDGVYESTQRVYGDHGKSPTLTASNADQLIETSSKPEHIGTAVDVNGHDILKRVYSPDGKSPTVNTCQGGNREPKVVAGAWRGRYNEDGSTSQKLELRKDTKSNSLTTVQKDSIVVSNKPKRIGSIKDGSQGNRIYSKDGKGITLSAQSGGTAGAGNMLIENQEVYWRKLTPLECERLQTVPDNYTNHVSNTQRYKMLGNGWTIEVITHILKNMEL